MGGVFSRSGERYQWRVGRQINMGGQGQGGRAIVGVILVLVICIITDIITVSYLDETLCVT